jgi:SAM-dependent methyltransferase
MYSVTVMAASRTTILDRIYLRRRQNVGWRPSYETGRITREDAADRGHERLSRLASRLESYTGASLESRRALDFGCGWGRLAIPLAKRCEHVYGVDVSSAVLQKAEGNADRANVRNIEWLQTERLGELCGRYDLLISMHVFQHIPVGEGERLFTTVVHGLRPGGVAAINLVLRPSHPWAGLLGQLTRPPRRSASSPNGAGGRRQSRLKMLREYRHMLMGAYSLHRLGRLLADEGVADWHVQFRRGANPYDAATIFFRKD